MLVFLCYTWYYLLTINATLISDSILVALQQMRGEGYHTIANGIIPRIETLTGHKKWACIIGALGHWIWHIQIGCDSYIQCNTDTLMIMLFR